MQCFYFIHVGTEIEKKWQIAVAFWKLMHSSILPVTTPPGQPRGPSPALRARGVNCLKWSCPGGRGAGQIENNFLLFYDGPGLRGEDCLLPVKISNICSRLFREE